MRLERMILVWNFLLWVLNFKNIISKIGSNVFKVKRIILIIDLGWMEFYGDIGLGIFKIV